MRRGGLDENVEVVADPDGEVNPADENAQTVVDTKSTEAIQTEGEETTPGGTEEPEVNEEPEVTEETKASEEPEVPEETEVSEEPKATEESKVNEEPKATEESKVNEEPKATEESKVNEEPKATEETEVSEEPKATEESKASEELKVTEAPTSEEVPAEVKAFLDAVAAIPAITTENVQEMAEYVYGPVSDAYEALLGTELVERADVKEAEGKYAAAIAAIDVELDILSQTFSQKESLFAQKYTIYDENFVYEFDCTTVKMDIHLDVGETWVDEGYFYVWDKRYGTYKVTSWNDFSIWSTNPDVLEVSAQTFSDGKLRITYTGKADGDANIRLAFDGVTHGTGDSIYNSPDMSGAVAAANCTITGIGVGTGTGNSGNTGNGESGTKPDNDNKYHYVNLPVGATMDILTLYLEDYEPPTYWINGYYYCIDVQNVVNYTSDENVAVITGEVYNGGEEYEYCDVVTPEITGVGPGDAEVYCTYSNSNNNKRMVEKFIVHVYEPETVTISNTKTLSNQYPGNTSLADPWATDDSVASVVWTKARGGNVTGLKVTAKDAGTTRVTGWHYSSKSINGDYDSFTISCDEWIVVVPDTKTYTVKYTDGVANETVFEDQTFTGLEVGSATPAFSGTPARKGYIFKGWELKGKDNSGQEVVRVLTNDQVKAKKILAADADANGVITYTATWERLKINGIEKKLVESASEIPDDVTVDNITYPDTDGKIYIPNGGSVTLLYKITVIGDEGAKYKVTDTGATWVSGPELNEENTIPEGGSAVIYVTREFTVNDIDANGKLVNNATVTPGKGNESSTTSTETISVKKSRMKEVTIVKTFIGKNGNKIAPDKVPSNFALDYSYTYRDDAPVTGSLVYSAAIQGINNLGHPTLTWKLNVKVDEDTNSTYETPLTVTESNYDVEGYVWEKQANLNSSNEKAVTGTYQINSTGNLPTNYIYNYYQKTPDTPNAPVISGEDGKLRVQVVCDSTASGHKDKKENLRLREVTNGITEYTGGEVVTTNKSGYDWEYTVTLYKSDFADRFEHNTAKDHEYVEATQDTVDVTFYYKDGEWDYANLQDHNPGVEIVYEKNGSGNYDCNYVVYHVEPKTTEPETTELVIIKKFVGVDKIPENFAIKYTINGTEYTLNESNKEESSTGMTLKWKITIPKGTKLDLTEEGTDVEGKTLTVAVTGALAQSVTAGDTTVQPAANSSGSTSSGNVGNIQNGDMQSIEVEEVDDDPPDVFGSASSSTSGTVSGSASTTVTVLPSITITNTYKDETVNPPVITPDKKGITLVKKVNGEDATDLTVDQRDGELTYTITVTNGTNVDLTNMLIRDKMPEGLKLVENSGSITVNNEAGSVIVKETGAYHDWTVMGTVPDKAVVVLTYKAVVDSEDAVEAKNVAKAFARAANTTNGVVAAIANFIMTRITVPDTEPGAKGEGGTEVDIPDGYDDDDFVSGSASTTVTVTVPGKDEIETPDGYTDEFESNEDDATVTVPEATGALSITKDTYSSRTEYKPGDEVDFRITVTNKSNKDAKNVKVTDILPEGLEFVRAYNPMSSENPKPVIDLVDNAYTFTTVAGGRFGWLAIVARVKDDVKPGTEIINTAFAKGDGTKTVEDSKTIKIVDEPDPTLQDLTIEKTIVDEKANYKIGDQIRFEIKIINSSAKNVTVNVTDILPDGLEFVEILGGFPGAENEGTVSWNDVSVEAGKSTVVSLSAKAVKAGSLTNKATVALTGKPDKTKETTKTVNVEEKLITRTVQIVKAFYGPSKAEVEAIKDNFSLNYTYTLDGETTTGTLYGKNAKFVTSGLFPGMDAVIAWDVDFKVIKGSNNSSENGTISFAEEGEEIEGWIWTGSRSEGTRLDNRTDLNAATNSMGLSNVYIKLPTPVEVHDLLNVQVICTTNNESRNYSVNNGKNDNDFWYTLSAIEGNAATGYTTTLTLNNQSVWAAQLNTKDGPRHVLNETKTNSDGILSTTLRWDADLQKWVVADGQPKTLKVFAEEMFTVTVNHLGDNGHKFWGNYNPEYPLKEGETYNHSIDDTMTALKYPNNPEVKSPKSFSIGNRTYVLDPMANNTPENELTGTMGKENVVINLYYSLDVKGGDDSAKPDGGPDGIPDKYQVKVTFEVKNGAWNDETTDDVVKYLTKYKTVNEEQVMAVDGEATLGSIIPAVGEKPDSGFIAGSWGDNEPAETTVITGDTTYTYTYQPAPGKVTITVNFVDENGNVVGTETVVVDEGDAYDVSEETGKIPEGYEPIGDPSGDPVTGTADADKIVTVPVRQIIRYTVTYTDGIDGEEVFADQVTSDLVSGAATPAFVGTPVREGYTFAGWTPAVAATVTGNVIYTAQWEAIPYTVTYTDGVDGEEVFVDQTTDNLTYGAATPAFVGTPVREGYTFAGWNPEVADTVTGDVVYTAQWTLVDPTPEEPTPEEPIPDDPTPEEPTPDDPTPEEPTPDDPTPEEPTPVDPTPVDPTPDDPTPEEPDDPTPAEPTTPTEPATPATPTTPVTPVPVAAQPATPAVTPVVVPVEPTTPAEQPVAQQPEVELEENETPLAQPQQPEEESLPVDMEIEDEPVPLAAGNGRAWALVNFALMNLAVFEALMLLIGYFVNTKKEEDERESQEKKLKKKGLMRVISLPVAIISIIAFCLTEDISLPTGFVDRWTILMAIIAIVQTVLVALSRKKEEKEDEEMA